MKAILMLSVSLLFMSTSFARTTSVHATLSVKAATEELAVEKAQKTIPSIMYATNREVLRAASWGKCTIRRKKHNKNYIKVKGVVIKKLYKLVDEVLEPYYQANINYVFKRCRESSRD